MSALLKLVKPRPDVIDGEFKDVKTAPARKVRDIEAEKARIKAEAELAELRYRVLAERIIRAFGLIFIIGLLSILPMSFIWAALAVAWDALTR